jgi:23S rRNA (cytosine1962-C5)-methyltransferase
LLSCSCTGLVGEADFLETLRRAAWQAGRTLQVVRVGGAGPDHPFLIHVPEGRYLKVVFGRVEGAGREGGDRGGGDGPAGG